MTAPCSGMWSLFDSTDPADHIQARRLCNECPLLAECRANLRATTRNAYSKAYGPAGTWAGELVGRYTRSARRMAAEEAVYAEADSRRAHAAYMRGDRDDWTTTGERIYQRRRKQQQRREVA